MRARSGTMDINPGKRKDLGRRIEVHWDGDGVYYRGTIVGYTATSRRHVIMYDDGDKERLCLVRGSCVGVRRRRRVWDACSMDAHRHKGTNTFVLVGRHRPRSTQSKLSELTPPFTLDGPSAQRALAPTHLAGHI